MSASCRPCLRRSHLIGFLAPGIARLLDRRASRPSGLLELGEEDLIGAVGGGRSEAATGYLEAYDDRAARTELEAAGIGAVCRHASAYPRSLLDLADPPATLYLTAPPVRLVELARAPVATIVGARRASAYALEVAHALGRGLGAAGVTVVSGLALGVDAAAHRGALAAGGRAVAVVASGVDVPYPAANRELYERLAERAIVVSELPPGVRAMRWSFPARNRIMAALAAITVVVEAGDPSGSLITAAHAEDLGRDVGAVPGWVTSRTAAGANRLLREGAGVIRCAEDVLDELFGAGLGQRRAEAAGGGPLGGSAGEGRRGSGLGLDAVLRAVLDGVEAGRGIDAIAEDAGVPAGDVRAALGRLELMGLIARDGLSSYHRKAC